MPEEPNLQPLDYRRPPEGRMPWVEDDEARRWRYARVSFRVGVVVLMVTFAFHFGPNLINFGKLGGLNAQDFVGTVNHDGVPTVRAIKQYQSDHGSWPKDIEALTPNYLNAAMIHGGQDFSCSGTTPQFEFWTKYNHRVIYDFTPGSERWTVAGPFVNGPIPLPPVAISPSAQPVSPSR